MQRPQSVCRSSQTNVASAQGAAEEYGEVKSLLAERPPRPLALHRLFVRVELAHPALDGCRGWPDRVPIRTSRCSSCGAGYIVLIVVQFLLTIQRAHDMNTTGWLSLICVDSARRAWCSGSCPGTNGENDYGKQPPPNTVGVILLACIVPFVIVGGGILAAIAIPAYQDYTIRAQVSEGLEPRRWSESRGRRYVQPCTSCTGRSSRRGHVGCRDRHAPASTSRASTSPVARFS